MHLHSAVHSLRVRIILFMYCLVRLEYEYRIRPPNLTVLLQNLKGCSGTNFVSCSPY